MASLALITSDTGHASATRNQSVLEGLGHVVTLVAEADLTTTDLSGYDALVGIWLTYANRATIAAELRSYIDSGIPLLLSLVTSGQPVNSFNDSISAELGLTGRSINRNPDATNATEIDITDTTHAITQSFADGRLEVYQAPNRHAALHLFDSFVGAELANGDPDLGLSSGATRTLIAIDQGTLDLDSNTVNARVVLFGYLYAGSSDYTTDGDTLIAAIMGWLLETTAQPTELEAAAILELVSTAQLQQVHQLTAAATLELIATGTLQQDHHLQADAILQLVADVAEIDTTPEPSAHLLEAEAILELVADATLRQDHLLQAEAILELVAEADLRVDDATELEAEAILEIVATAEIQQDHHLQADAILKLVATADGIATEHLLEASAILELVAYDTYMGPGTGLVVGDGRLTTAEVLAMAEEGDSFNALQPWGGIEGRVGTYTILERTITDERARPEFAFAFDPLSDPDDVPVQRGGGRVRYRPPVRSDPYRAQKRRRRD